MGRVNPFCTIYFLLAMISGAWADGAVEVISGGNRYKSIEAYKAAETTFKPGQPGDSLQENTNVLDNNTSALESIGYEHGMSRALSGFSQDWDHPIPSFEVSSDHLEERIRSLVEGRKEPVLFVSDAKKLRVFGLGEGKLEGTQPEQ